MRYNISYVTNPKKMLTKKVYKNQMFKPKNAPKNVTLL